MSLPVATSPTNGSATIASGDATAFWAYIADFVTLPSGYTNANVSGISLFPRADGSISITLSFKP